MTLLNALDVSVASWEGCGIAAYTTDYTIQHYLGGSTDSDSLFYIFNTLPSPTSCPVYVSCPASQDAIQSVCEAPTQPGLKRRLYPYQRRTVTTMIRREVEPARALDPRLEPLKGPTGIVFYFDRQTGILLRDRREYDEVRGGILGESMGLGKTLMCLALVVATKGHWPQIPPEYSLGLQPIRPETASLMQMAAAAISCVQIPWRTIFQNLSKAGEDHQNCLDALEDNASSYVIPPSVARRSRRPSVIPKGETIHLCTATLIIVPENLLSQWASEIALHVEEQCLNILFLDSIAEVSIPSADKLLQSDVILLSRQRFEREMVPSETVKALSKSKGGCRCSLDEDCQCSIKDEYHSPLKKLHFLRVIMDEGHEFSASGRKNNSYWALQKLHVERKWVVSGTPASGLVGVEVGTATYETSNTPEESQPNFTNTQVLQTRRKETALPQEQKDLEKLGAIVVGFLQLKPWSNSRDDDPASWQKYIMPCEDGRKKARSLKALMGSLVVRHRLEDIEADIQLPPLHNRVVYLRPSWHDKLSINLFILSLLANAVTSERMDEDYMFHSKNRRQLNLLITNLRQSGFYWTSFSPDDIAKTLQVSRAYLDAHSTPGSNCDKSDMRVLEQALQFGELVLQSDSWKKLASLHEMGMFVEEFPESARNAWSLVERQGSEPLLVGATQLIKAQSWIDTHLYVSNPSDGLASVGTSTMQKLWNDAKREESPEGIILDRNQNSPSRPRMKSRTGAGGPPKLTEKQTVSRAKAVSSPRKIKPVPTTNDSSVVPSKPALKSALKPSATKAPADIIPPGSPLKNCILSGTASVKLSYLLDRVLALHLDEKILIFYEGDHIAYYIAQAFDLVDVRYLIYTRTLSLARQNAYITTFNSTETFRVLLMNVHQAAHGLHIASASRVFFVNPVWQPHVEAQAIKRAHRIGQTRPVFVETLVLENTVEDQMLKRRKNMTAQEHRKAEKSLLDDETMSTIIKNAKFLPLMDEEIHNVHQQIAKLQNPQLLFARIGKGTGDIDDPDTDLIFPVDTLKSKNKGRKRKADD